MILLICWLSGILSLFFLALFFFLPFFEKKKEHIDFAPDNLNMDRLQAILERRIKYLESL